MTTNWWTGKQNVARILCSHEKERSTETFYNMAKRWKHCVKWKKSDTKGHILYDLVYMKCPEDSRWVVARGWEDKIQWKAVEISFWGDENVLELMQYVSAITIKLLPKRLGGAQLCKPAGRVMRFVYSCGPQAWLPMRITRGVSGTNASPTWTAHIRSSWGCDWPLQFLNLPRWFWDVGNTGSGNWQMQMQTWPRCVSLLMTRPAHLALSPSKPLLLHFVTFENKSAAREAMCSTFIIH